MFLKKTNRSIDRINRMIDNAVEGRPIENGFDESKVSALETKLAAYLAMTQTSRKHLEEEKKKINELISDISHQTKTPVANILLYSQLLEESNLPEKEAACAHALAAQAEKLNFLISSLVKVSRLENGIISLNPKYQPLQPLLDEVQVQSRGKAEQKGIGLHFDDTEAAASFDAKWTAEAVLNIVDNAIKYSPAGGEITIRVNVYPLFCRMDIQDNGMGIDESEQAKIFTRFYRSQAVSGEDGIGLGLYLAREIIAGEGGYIKVSSGVGSGSTFSVFLPITN